MPFRSMYKELGGSVPKIPLPFCKTLVNRAWRDLRRKSLWSFQLFESNWFSPSVLNGGKVTVTQGSNQVVFDATASAAINALGLVPSPITSRQFRVGFGTVGTIYSIWAWDGNSTATLDRAYVESSAVGSAYSICQCYYPAPMKDFKSFISVRDPVNAWELETTRNREWVDERDPQRQNFQQPKFVIPFMLDQNPNSATLGFMLFELWGQPQFRLPYIIYGIRKGVDLVNDADELPAAIGEDCVMALAKVYAYEWAESNKADQSRMVGPDFRFLIGDAKREYVRLFREYRREDRELVDNWIAVRRSDSLRGAVTAYYNSIGGVASPGIY